MIGNEGWAAHDNPESIRASDFFTNPTWAAWAEAQFQRLAPVHVERLKWYAWGLFPHKDATISNALDCLISLAHEVAPASFEDAAPTAVAKFLRIKKARGSWRLNRRSKRSPYSPSTLWLRERMVVTFLRSFWPSAKIVEFAVVRPHYAAPAKRSEDEVLISSEEFAALLEAAKCDRDRDILLLGRASGARAGALTAIQLGHYALQEPGLWSLEVPAGKTPGYIINVAGQLGQALQDCKDALLADGGILTDSFARQLANPHRALLGATASKIVGEPEAHLRRGAVFRGRNL